MKPTIDYTLYLVTDRDIMNADSIEVAVESSIQGGCTLVQLREKAASSLDFFNYAGRVKQVTDRHGVPLIINDRVDIALAVGAAGVHVGQSDLPVAEVRRLIGPDKILGASASTLDEAMAVAVDADYLGIGAMFATNTKSEADLTFMDELRRIRAALKLPIVVIGGINLETIPLFRGTGIDGIAVVSAALAAPDIEEATRKLRLAFSGIAGAGFIPPAQSGLQ